MGECVQKNKKKKQIMELNIRYIHDTVEINLDHNFTKIYLFWWITGDIELYGFGQEFCVFLFFVSEFDL